MTSPAQPASAASEIKLLYTDFVSEYDRADALCGRVQAFRQEAGIPANNEMRYAGYHLRNALDDNGQIVSIDQLRRAKGHAQRACYEAAEAGLALALKEIRHFETDYRKVIVTGDVKDYIQILQRSAEANDRLGVKRQLGDGQQLDHNRHMELFDYLSNAANLLKVARPEINKRMAEARTTKIRWLITLFIAILGIIGAFNKERIWAYYDSLHAQGGPKANITAPSSSGNPRLPNGATK